MKTSNVPDRKCAPNIDDTNKKMPLFITGATSDDADTSADAADAFRDIFTFFRDVTGAISDDADDASDAADALRDIFTFFRDVTGAISDDADNASDAADALRDVFTLCSALL
jgi:hypothetical protein